MYVCVCVRCDVFATVAVCTFARHLTGQCTDLMCTHASSSLADDIDLIYDDTNGAVGAADDLHTQAFGKAGVCVCVCVCVCSVVM